MNWSDRDFQQFFRFLIVGSFNTGISYLVYAIALYVGFSFTWANLCAVIFGIAVSFKTQGKFVFYNEDFSLIFKYVVFWIILWTSNIAIIYLLNFLTHNDYISGAIALLPITATSFLLQKKLIFKKSAA